MKVKILIVMCMSLLITVTAQTVFAAGALKLAVANETIASGEDLGVVLLLSGNGNHDVYAALTGGVLGDGLFMFTPAGLQVAGVALPKLMDNVNIGNLDLDARIIQLLPKFPIDDGASLAGTYYFYVAFCTPGMLDFIALDMVAVTIE